MVKKLKKRKAAKAGEVAVPPDAAAPVQKPARKRRSAVANADKPGSPPAKAEATEAEVTETKQTLFQTNASFSKLGLAKWIVQTCAKLGMNYPTDIQAMCIPAVLAGKNLAGNARTGSGKTACYSMPILHHLSKDPYGVFALILVPVRELAFQVTENFRAMGQAINVKVGEIVGGRDFSIQSKMIADRTHVIVATPGRLADLLRGDFALAKAFRKLHTLVLDEAETCHYRILCRTFGQRGGRTWYDTTQWNLSPLLAYMVQYCPILPLATCNPWLAHVGPTFANPLNSRKPQRGYAGTSDLFCSGHPGDAPF